MSDDESADQFMQMAAGAASLKQLYDAYIAVGFTEQQAMQLLHALISTVMGAQQ